MALVVAAPVADGQVFNMAVAAFAQRLNMFQRCVRRLNMRAAHPTRHLAMQLARDGVVNFDSGVGEFAHLVFECSDALMVYQVKCGSLMYLASCPPGFALLLYLRKAHEQTTLRTLEQAASYGL